MRAVIGMFALSLVAWCPPHAASAQSGKYVVKPVVEKKIAQLPEGPLHWRIETFPTLAAAQAAAGPTALAAEIEGKAWLFTLGAAGGATAGGTRVAEIGPIAPIKAAEYLLRINHAFGPPGSKTRTHTHPGSEIFYVLAGRVGQKTPHGVMYGDAGQSITGHGGDVPMEVFSAGDTEARALVMFVVDATRPFSSPAQLP